MEQGSRTDIQRAVKIYRAHYRNDGLLRVEKFSYRLLGGLGKRKVLVNLEGKLGGMQNFCTPKKRIEDELDGEMSGCKTFATEGGGTPMRYYDLTLDQCLLVGMRE